MTPLTGPMPVAICASSCARDRPGVDVRTQGPPTPPLPPSGRGGRKVPPQGFGAPSRVPRGVWGAKPPTEEESEGGWVGQSGPAGYPRVNRSSLRVLVRDGGVGGRSPPQRGGALTPALMGFDRIPEGLPKRRCSAAALPTARRWGIVRRVAREAEEDSDGQSRGQDRDRDRSEPRHRQGDRRALRRRGRERRLRRAHRQRGRQPRTRRAGDDPRGHPRRWRRGEDGGRQHRRGGGVPAPRRGDAGGLRADRHPREQRRHELRAPRSRSFRPSAG